jgi:hypothetical protein
VPATTLKAWASFKPDRIGAGTIYHLAMERGWQPEQTCVSMAACPKTGTIRRPLLARLDVTAAVPSAPRPRRRSR